jgi:Lon protease-like protein
MSVELEELPLFPLNTVLFPYASVQLHVFEDRYRRLVHDCLEYDRPFGIVLIRSGEEIGGLAEPYLVGTAVRIQQVHHFDDGRMDIHVQGERRFRIRRLEDDGPYMRGFVEPVVEIEPEGSPREEALVMKAREDFQMLVEGLFSSQDVNVQVLFPSDPVVLSFTIANLVPMENLDKQRLLETTDTVERIRHLIPILERQLVEAKPALSHRRLNSSELAEWITPN